MACRAFLRSSAQPKMIDGVAEPISRYQPNSLRLAFTHTIKASDSLGLNPSCTASVFADQSEGFMVHHIDGLDLNQLPLSTEAE